MFAFAMIDLLLWARSLAMARFSTLKACFYQALFLCIVVLVGSVIGLLINKIWVPSFGLHLLVVLVVLVVLIVLIVFVV